jgi:hypothetical protein
MTDINLDAIPSVELLRPQPGDIVVLLHPGRLPPVAIENLHKSIKPLLPAGVRAIVLEEGMDIKLLRPEKAEQYVVEGGKEGT